MKPLKHLIAVFALSALTFSCEKEMIQPESQAEAQFYGTSGVQRPATPCGTSAFTNLVDAQGNVMGTVEITNDATNLHIIFSSVQGRSIDELRVFMGDVALVDFDGTHVLTEAFQFQSIFNTPQTRYTVIQPLTGLGACADIVVLGKVSARNQFGVVTNRRDVYLDGLPLYNIEEYKYCINACGAATSSDDTI